MFEMFPFASGEAQSFGAAFSRPRSESWSQSFRESTLDAVLDAMEGTEMSLERLCKKITTFEALYHAIILGSECYVTNTVVRHRYIILKLWYDNQTFWIRIDRRRGGAGMLSFIFGSSTSPSNDTVREYGWISFVYLTNQRLLR